MTHRFEKVEGLGNDFLLLDRRHESLTAIESDLPRLSGLASRLCDRRRGVGGDGLLIVGPPRHEQSRATMWVINFDGSRPEMCGNGLRCVAHHVAVGGASREFDIDTDAGIKHCRVDPAEAHAQVTIDMGPGRDLGSVHPVAGAGRDFRAVSMGNPHAVTFVTASEDPEQLARELGPPIETDVAFPRRTNVEFGQLHERPEPGMTLWVWERGVGITQACGTGACAAACAAAWSGRLPQDVALAVDLPGGRLWVTVPSDPARGVTMKGPAHRVFSGTILL